ncbi:hypothetical protein BDR07DRAFT_1490283 [Suillus spraguei]|nr:hypothetical protein BDR07DRAFT_1490283 [Suillus spraguei]
MLPAEWTTPDQKAFLESKYNNFLKAQVGASAMQFWGPVFLEWFRRFPEELAIFGEAPEVLSEEQKEAKGAAVELRQKKIKNWFNYRSQESGRSAVNAMGKTIWQMLTNKAKGTQIHTEAEVFSKMRYTDDVQVQVKESIASGSLTKSEKLGAVKMMTRTAYEDASEDIKALCRAKVQAERDAKASEVLKKTDEAPTNAQYARLFHLEDATCTALIPVFIKLFPPALQLSPITPHSFTQSAASHSLPSLPPIATRNSRSRRSLPHHSLPTPFHVTPQFSLPLVLPAPVLPTPTLLTPVLPAPILPSSVLPAPVLPSIPPAPPAAETPQNGDVQHSAPEKTLKVKRKRMSKVVDTVMEVVESANPNTLRKTGRIRQESTRMAQANQIGQINKRSRTRR